MNARLIELSSVLTYIKSQTNCKNIRNLFEMYNLLNDFMDNEVLMNDYQCNNYEYLYKDTITYLKSRIQDEIQEY